MTTRPFKGAYGFGLLGRKESLARRRLREKGLLPWPVLDKVMTVKLK